MILVLITPLWTAQKVMKSVEGNLTALHTQSTFNMMALGITTITILSGLITTAGTGLMELHGALAGTTLGGACITHGLQAGAGAGTHGTMATAMAGDTATAGMIGVLDQEAGMTVTMPGEMALMNITGTETEAAEA